MLSPYAFVQNLGRKFLKASRFTKDFNSFRYDKCILPRLFFYHWYKNNPINPLLVVYRTLKQVMLSSYRV